MKLEGHKGEVLGLAFHPVAGSAHLLASSSFDGTVMVWDTSLPDIPAVSIFKGHRLAVTDVVFAGRDGGLAATASADGTAALWDVVTGERLKVLRGHRSHVNAIAVPPPAGATVSGGPLGGAATLADADASGGLGEYTVATASNDKTVRVWDGRDRRRGAELLLPHRAQALAVAWGEADHLIYSSGVDGDVLGWDLRAASCAWAAAPAAGGPAAVAPPAAAVAGEAAGCVRQLRGHTEPVTGLALNTARTHLVSNAMDHSVRVWDVRPFVAGGEAARQAAVLIGHRHGFDKSLLRAAWGGRDEVVAAGAADGTLWVWEVADRTVRYRLPGHAGPVNAVAFHATQPVVASGGADKVIFLGELLL